MPADSTKPPVRRCARDQYRFDPLVEPSWRFDRVLTMLAHQPRALRCNAHDDRYARVMRAFMLKRQSRDADAREQLYPEFPGPFVAMRIHSDPAPETRLFLQCRLLAGQSDEEIAKKLGTSPEAVEWYEKVFYSVRDRLDHRDWVVRHILGPARLRNLSNFEVPLKLFAYFRGPDVLDYLITGFRGTERPQTGEEIDRSVDDDVRAGVRLRAALSVGLFKVDQSNILPLLNLCRQISAEAKTAEAMSPEIEGVYASLREMLEEMEFITGDRALEVMSKSYPDLAGFDQSAVELRDQDLYAVA